MDKRIKGLMAACCSLGVAMLASDPAWSVAAQEAASPSSMTLEELDEIVLNGKRMEQRMLESEQRFYQRYNMLNARQDFDVTCSYFARTRNSSGFGDSSFMQRCVPAFFSDAVEEETALMSMSTSTCSPAFTPIRFDPPIDNFGGALV